ncbi:MAG: hypothetical protein OEU92_22275 [Alphaproteobacteria bacterium]|nr:hypothetical protein [Alphaproteobacteria bacterium]
MKDEPQGWPEDHPLGQGVPKTGNDLAEVDRKVSAIIDQADPEAKAEADRMHEEVVKVSGKEDNVDEREER